MSESEESDCESVVSQEPELESEESEAEEEQVVVIETQMMKIIYIMLLQKFLLNMREQGNI